VVPSSGRRQLADRDGYVFNADYAADSLGTPLSDATHH